MPTFVDDVLAGRTSPEAIDDYVERWHGGDGDGELADYLGLSHAEYDAWIGDAKALARIIAARNAAPRPREPA